MSRLIFIFGRHISRFALKRLMKLIRQGLERGMFMTFGEKVRSLRKEKKMSQQELASICLLYTSPSPRD